MSSDLPPETTDAPPHPTDPSQPPSAAGGVSNDERTWGMLCHLTSLSWLFGIPGFIGPLIIWLIKKDELPFVDDQGKEALNFQISVFLYGVVAGVLVLCAGIGLLLLPFVGLFSVILAIVATIRANQGDRYRYPLTLRLIP